jgi:4-hydroxy-3-methylbut-2-enyl diphosphate reductase
MEEFHTQNVIGITAGASTPASIIKEVIRKMSNETNMDGTIVEEAETTLQEPETSPKQEVSEPEAPAEETKEEAASAEQDDETEEDESFEALLEKSIKTLRTGEKVSGIVTSVTATEVSVDLGTKQSGYIPISEFIENDSDNIEDVVKEGDTIEAFVMRVNDVEGMVMLSKRRLDAIKNWDIVESARENKSIVEGVVSEENKGGIVVNVKGVRVFVPASQTGLPKSAQMSELLKKPVKLRITEVNQSRRRVVGSIRLVQSDERREKAEQVWNDIEVGKKYDGVVKSMTSYGVFVDIGGVDGMVHISELSWTRIKQPSEVMSVGDEVSVYVISFDAESKKISLGYKKGEDNPWTKFTETYKVGDIANVKVVKMMPFGAFAEICTGVDGLIHISQVTDRRIGLPSEVLSDGEMVDVKITEIDHDRKKVSLSIRALLESSDSSDDNYDASEEDDDKAPSIVYDTDNPPQMDEEEVIEEEILSEETSGASVE